MKWRYQNLRMLLHRSVLLSLASSGSTHAAEHDIAAIETCRDLAQQTIEDIAREWTRNQMSGWNAVWFLYQAAMIPLVSVFWQWNSARVPEWHKQIETVLELLDAMEDWSLAARRSREVVFRMYEASRNLQRQQQHHRSQSPADSTTSSHHMGMTGGRTSPRLIIGPSADTAVEMPHMSPIGIVDPESIMGMMGVSDQQSLWDLDGMLWGQHDEFDAGAYGFHDNMMMSMDYNMMGNDIPATTAAALDHGYPYVH